MAVLRKLLICPYFGDLPPWFDLWRRNVAELEADGYDVLLDHDLPGFKARIKDTLGIDAPIVSGEAKMHDYRCTFGLLYADELAGYDFWGHTDFDVVYGRVAHFINDTRLAGLDLFSNHDTYVSGPWSLYKNTETMNTLFKRHEDWRGHLTNPSVTGWVELSYSEIVAYCASTGEIQILWESWQPGNLNNFDAVRWDNGRLMDGRQETMYVHFRRTKVYPAHLIR